MLRYQFLLLPLTFLFFATARRAGFLWPRMADCYGPEIEWPRVLGPPLIDTPSDHEKCKYGQIASVCSVCLLQAKRYGMCAYRSKGTQTGWTGPQGQEITGRGIRALALTGAPQTIQNRNLAHPTFHQALTCSPSRIAYLACGRGPLKKFCSPIVQNAWG